MMGMIAVGRGVQRRVHPRAGGARGYNHLVVHEEVREHPAQLAVLEVAPHARDADLRLLVARQLGRGRVERHRLWSGEARRACVSARECACGHAWGCVEPRRGCCGMGLVLRQVAAVWCTSALPFSCTGGSGLYEILAEVYDIVASSTSSREAQSGLEACRRGDGRGDGRR